MQSHIQINYQSLLDPYVHINKKTTHTLNIFVDILDDAGQSGHVLLSEGHTQIVANEVVPGLQHGCGDEIQNARGQT